MTRQRVAQVDEAARARPIPVAIRQHDREDRINLGTVGRAARRMRVACSGDPPSTRIGGLENALIRSEMLASTRRP
jgi:hypothetical protein